jgi:AbrB family looped-hinge helix DNA binding protein
VTGFLIKHPKPIVKWGNSVGFVLPKPIRDGMKLKAGDEIRIVVEDNRIYVEKAK